MDKAVRGSRDAGSSRSKDRLSFRVTPTQYGQLVDDADGTTSLSALIHARVFGGGVTDKSVLRKIAALHRVGRAVEVLNEQPSANAAAIAAVLDDVRVAIKQLAEQLP